MYCQFCGSQYEENAKFCKKCGKPVTTNNEVKIINEANNVSAGSQSNTVTQPQVQVQRNVKQPEKKIKAGMTTLASILFWIAWVSLLVMSLSMMWYQFSVIQAAVFAVLLCMLLFLRKKLFCRVLPSIAAWFGTFLIFCLAVGITGNIDPQRDKEIGEIQSAFEEKDAARVTEYLHPENKGHMKAVFVKHQAELDKVGKLMSTKRLIFADKNYAEYEVKDNGKKYVMIFEKVQGKWRLSRF